MGKHEGKLLPMDRDQVFADPAAKPGDFVFSAEVAGVFDDMVNRSVPFYAEMQRICCELARDFATDGSNLYDLGCSTGTTLMALDRTVTPGTRFIGVDNSQPMLDKARAKFNAAGVTRSIDLICDDLHRGPVIEDASVVTMILTLQFIRPLHREHIVRRIAHGLKENGCLILVEKLTMENSMLNRMFIDYYYDLKRRNGYSETEITQKREALENVLIPYRFEENKELLLRNGFSHVEEAFRWYNFCIAIAVR